jgi:Fic family protein
MVSMATDYASVRREIDRGLGSVGRLRIIAELAREPEERLTVYNISAATHLKRSDVKANLAHLLAIGWVKEHRTYPVKYQINLSNETALKLVNFLRSIRYV